MCTEKGTLKERSLLLQALPLPLTATEDRMTLVGEGTLQQNMLRTLPGLTNLGRKGTYTLWNKHSTTLMRFLIS